MLLDEGRSALPVGQVRQNKRPPGGGETSVLLQSLWVLAYSNKDTWFDVHPLLWRELGEIEE